MRIVKPSFEIWDRSCDQLALIERAGRVCYQSEPKGDAEGFVRRILSRKPPHGSVLEHAWFAVKGGWFHEMPPFMEEVNGVLLGNARAWRNSVRSRRILLPNDLLSEYRVLFGDLGDRPTDANARLVPFPDGLVFTVDFIVDRGVSHELVRHRPPSFSQESTRYCNYGAGVTFIRPPWLGDGVWISEEKNIEPFDVFKCAYTGMPAHQQWITAMAESEQRYLTLLTNGWTPQQARSVLPNSLKTQIVVTAYWTEWQIIFALRAQPSAHPQMQEVMVPLQKKLAEKYPEKFSDEVIAGVRDNLG